LPLEVLRDKFSNLTLKNLYAKGFGYEQKQPAGEYFQEAIDANPNCASPI
jgi:hypothetical protein